jgi:hypothetical protein
VPRRPCGIVLAAAIACSGTPPPARGTGAPPAAGVADARNTGPTTPTTPATLSAGAAALAQDLPRLVERSLVMYQDLAQALAASGGDCAAAAGSLGRLATTYRDVVAANARVLRDGRAAQLRAALEPHGEAFDRAAQAILQAPVVAACAKDPAFAGAFDDLLEPPP